MDREARSPPDLAAVTWRAPPGWIAPDWLEPEPEPAGLPMTKDRFRWCLHVIGWNFAELGRRLNVHETSIRQMGTGRRNIPHVLALWLEGKAKATLEAPLVPEGWRTEGGGSILPE